MGRKGLVLDLTYIQISIYYCYLSWEKGTSLEDQLFSFNYHLQDIEQQNFHSKNDNIDFDDKIEKEYMHYKCYIYSLTRINKIQSE